MLARRMATVPVPSRHGLTAGVSSSPTISARPARPFNAPDLYEGDLRANSPTGRVREQVGFETIIERAFAPPRVAERPRLRGFSLGVLPRQKLAQTVRARGGAASNSCVPASMFGARGRSRPRFRST